MFKHKKRPKLNSWGESEFLAFKDLEGTAHFGIYKNDRYEDEFTGETFEQILGWSSREEILEEL